MAKATVDIPDLQNGTCPPVCVQCGRPAIALVRVTFPHLPRRAGCLGFLLGLPLGYLPALLFAVAQSVSVSAILPVCERHGRPGAIPTWQRTGRWLFILLGALITLLFIGLIGQELFRGIDLRSHVCGGIVGLFLLGWLMLLTHFFQTVRITEVNDRTATLSNASYEFAAAVDAQREADRHSRIAKWSIDGHPPEASS